MLDGVRLTSRIGPLATSALRELGGTFGERLEGPALVQHLQAHGDEPHPAVADAALLARVPRGRG